MAGESAMFEQSRSAALVVAVPSPPPQLDPHLVHRLLDGADLLFVQLTGDGLITWIGASCTEAIGWDRDELIGRHILEFIHPEDQEPTVLTMAEEVRGGFERVSMVVRVAHADGRWISYEFGGIDTRSQDQSGAYLVWGRSYETTNRLMDFLGALMAGAPLADLLQHVVDWYDGDSSATGTAILARRPDGRYACLAANPSLPAELRVSLAVIAADAGRPEGLEGTEGPEGTEPWVLAVRGVHAAGTRTPIAGTGDLSCMEPALADVAKASGYLACWAVGVGSHGDAPDAIQVIWHPRSGPLLVSHLSRIASAHQIIRLATSWSRGREALVLAATTDALTGLTNRSRLAELMDLDHDAMAAMLICDLDCFKGVNDAHGHLVGDRVLVAVSRRLQSAVCATDVVARIGGDEFAIWSPAITDAASAERTAQRLIDVLAEPIVIDDTTHLVGCSIGIAVVPPAPASQRGFDRLLGAADRALYEAKAAGKGIWIRADDVLPVSD